MVNPFRQGGRRSVRPIVSRGPRIHFPRNPSSTTQHGAKASAFLRRGVLAACLLGTALVPIPARAQGVYVASAGSDSVTAVDGTTMTVIGKPVPVDAAPTALAVTPDGKTVIATVVTAKDGQRVVVIDAVRNQRQRFLKPFGPPIAVSVEPTPRSGGRLLFEVLVRDGPFGPGISFFNLKRMAWIHFTRGRRNSSLLAVTPDGARIYVPGTDRKTGTAFLSEFHFFFTAGQSHTGLRHDIDLAGGAISALGITPDSRFVIVATEDASGGIVNVVDRANNNQVTSSGLGSGVLPENLAIGHNAGGSFGLLTTNQVLVRLSSSGNLGTITSNATLFPGHFTPSKVALTPNGAVAYLTDGAQPFVARLDVPGGGGFGGVQMVRLPNATTPAALAVSPDGHAVFVAQGDPTTGGGVVSRIDVSSNAVTSVAVEGQPVALAVGPAVAQSGRSSGSGGGSTGGGGGSSCSGTLKSCGVTCVDLAVDPASCGACGNACPRGDICASHRCECPQGHHTCNGSCVDLSSDAANCGACGNVCSAGTVCASGRCVCPASDGVCGGRCVNLARDRKNCGRCGTVCAPGESCAAGSCVCAAGHAVCNGTCVDLGADTANCGRCKRACIPGDICASGSCVCPPGRTECSGQCVNTELNLINCGTCGRVCLPGDACVSGHCTCPDGHRVCRDHCIDITKDPANCGGCGQACAPGQQCVGGRCG